MSILDYLYNDGGIRNTLSELRPEIANMAILENLADHLFDGCYDGSLGLTITFRENILDTFKESHIHKVIQDELNRVSNKFLITLLQDYSSVGRLHYHGVIKADNPKGLDTFKRRLTKLFGRVELRPLRYRFKWICYMLKYYFNHNERVSPKNIVSNDTSLFKVYIPRDIQTDVKDEFYKQISKFLYTD